MPDLIEEIKEKQRQRTKSTALTTIIVLLGMAAVIAISVKNDKDRQKALYTNGGAVGVENKTYHQVTLSLFMHDKSEEPVISHTIEPRGHWVIRDSMSKWEVSNFPPIDWLDSAYLVFDDTLLLRHNAYPVWNISYGDHCIHDNAQWKYESLVVRPHSRYHPALYRPLRVYYITDEDYERAVQANKPKTFINP